MGQISAFGALADLLAIEFGLGLRAGGDEDRGPLAKRRGRFWRALKESLVGALADVTRVGGVRNPAGSGDGSHGLSALAPASGRG